MFSGFIMFDKNKPNNRSQYYDTSCIAWWYSIQFNFLNINIFPILRSTQQIIVTLACLIAPIKLYSICQYSNDNVQTHHIYIFYTKLVCSQILANVI